MPFEMPHQAHDVVHRRSSNTIVLTYSLTPSATLCATMTVWWSSINSLGMNKPAPTGVLSFTFNKPGTIITSTSTMTTAVIYSGTSSYSIDLSQYQLACYSASSNGACYVTASLTWVDAGCSYLDLFSSCTHSYTGQVSFTPSIWTNTNNNPNSVLSSIKNSNIPNNMPAYAAPGDTLTVSFSLSNVCGNARVQVQAYSYNFFTPNSLLTGYSCNNGPCTISSWSSSSSFSVTVASGAFQFTVPQSWAADNKYQFLLTFGNQQVWSDYVYVASISLVVTSPVADQSFAVGSGSLSVNWNMLYTPTAISSLQVFLVQPGTVSDSVVSQSALWYASSSQPYSHAQLDMSAASQGNTYYVVVGYNCGGSISSCLVRGQSPKFQVAGLSLSVSQSTTSSAVVSWQGPDTSNGGTVSISLCKDYLWPPLAGNGCQVISNVFMSSGSLSTTNIPPSIFPYYFQLAYDGNTVSSQRFTVSSALGGGWNYNTASVSAVSPSIVLVSQTCNDLECENPPSTACSFCSNGGSFTFTATCESCYVGSTNFISTFKAQLGYASVGYLYLAVTGSLNIYIQIQLDLDLAWSKTFEQVLATVPLVALPSVQIGPISFQLGLFFQLSGAFEIGFTAQGFVSTGFDTSIQYSVVEQYPAGNAQSSFTMTSPLAAMHYHPILANVSGTAQVTVGIIPAVLLSLPGVFRVSVFTEAYVQAAVAFQVPAFAAATTAVLPYSLAPFHIGECNVSHFFEYFVAVGVKHCSIVANLSVTFGLDTTLIGPYVKTISIPSSGADLLGPYQILDGCFGDVPTTAPTTIADSTPTDALSTTTSTALGTATIGPSSSNIQATAATGTDVDNSTFMVSTTDTPLTSGVWTGSASASPSSMPAALTSTPVMARRNVNNNKRDTVSARSSSHGARVVARDLYSTADSSSLLTYVNYGNDDCTPPYQASLTFPYSNSGCVQTPNGLFVKGSCTSGSITGGVLQFYVDIACSTLLNTIPFRNYECIQFGPFSSLLFNCTQLSVPAPTAPPASSTPGLPDITLFLPTTISAPSPTATTASPGMQSSINVFTLTNFRGAACSRGGIQGHYQVTVRLSSGVCTLIPNGYFVHSTCSAQGGFLAFFVDPQCTIQAKVVSFLQNLCIASSVVNSLASNCSSLRSSPTPASPGPQAGSPPLATTAPRVTQAALAMNVTAARSPATLRVVYTLFQDQACAANTSRNVSFLFGSDTASCSSSSNGFFVYGSCDGAKGTINFFSDNQCSTFVSTVSFVNHECITFDLYNSGVFSCHYLSDLAAVSPSSSSSSSGLSQGSLIAVIVCSIVGVGLAIIAMQV